MKNKFIFNRQSIFIFILGLICLIVGYLFMASGDITVSPILLVIAYVILFPLSIIIGIIKKPGNKDNNKITK